MVYGTSKIDDDRNDGTFIVNNSNCTFATVISTTTIVFRDLNGSKSCSFCDVGFFGSTEGFCSECADGKFTENKGLLECGECMNGQVNNKKSSCIKCAVVCVKDDKMLITLKK